MVCRSYLLSYSLSLDALFVDFVVRRVVVLTVVGVFGIVVFALVITSIVIVIITARREQSTGPT
jgi:hypothetical protein